MARTRPFDTGASCLNNRKFQFYCPKSYAVASAFVIRLLLKISTHWFPVNFFGVHAKAIV